MNSTSDTAVDWSERIRWILDEYEGGSRRALGRKIDLSGQAVSAWARGDTRPSGPGLAALLEAYPELNARWLLTGTGPPRRSQRPAAWEDALADAEFRSSWGNGTGGESEDDDDPAPLDVARAYRRGWLDAVRRMKSSVGDALEDLLEGVEAPEETGVS